VKGSLPSSRITNVLPKTRFAGRFFIHVVFVDNPEVPMRHLLIILTLICFLPVLSLAESTNSPMTFSIPQTEITDSTLIEGIGWSGTGNTDEQLACEIAENRALLQLKQGIAVARLKNMVSQEELMHAFPLTIYRQWNRSEGRCVMKMHISIPGKKESHFSRTQHRLY
jgi:hypothetical protein